MAIDYPFYEISAGKRKGVHQFLYVTETEYRQWGEKRAKTIEWERIRSRRISADPEQRAKWTARRAHRRKTVPGLREREVRLERDRRTRRLTLR
jgi:hypothetical protein